MQFVGLITTSSGVRGQFTSLNSAARGCSLMLIGVVLAAVAGAQSGSGIPLGLAWQVKGAWHVDGDTNPIETGNMIEPRALLWPMEGSVAHSITILLPDGQRIFYECFLAEDCSRGFRVPSLMRKPDPQAAEMLWRIHAALTAKGSEPESAPRIGSPLPRDEAVAILDGQSRVEVTGLVAALSDGRYTYSVRAFGHTEASLPAKTIEKKGTSVTLEMPAPGLYEVVIHDLRNTPRVDLLIAAVTASQGEIMQGSFRAAKAKLKDWNSDFQGWPIHDFQRAYLESLILGINPQIPHRSSIVSSTQKNRRPDVVAEPVFTPGPGVFQGDTAVALRCDTPGATIHFTLDNSQPLASSPVYSAPIMVKGTALTIKAFATAQGKSQSAVVTGIFMIGE